MWWSKIALRPLADCGFTEPEGQQARRIYSSVICRTSVSRAILLPFPQYYQILILMTIQWALVGFTNSLIVSTLMPNSYFACHKSYTSSSYRIVLICIHIHYLFFYLLFIFRRYRRWIKPEVISRDTCLQRRSRLVYIYD